MDESLLRQLQGLSLVSSEKEDQLTLKDVEELWKEYFSDPEISVEVLRALRKLAASLTDLSQKQELLKNHASLFNLCYKVLEKNITSHNPQEVLCLRVALQFLFNAFQGNHDQILELKSLEGLFIKLLSRNTDPKVQDYTSSLIYLGNKDGRLFLRRDEIHSLLITACIQYESHFALLALQFLIQDDLVYLFHSLKANDKVPLLQIVSSNEESLTTSAPQVSSLFKECSKQIMNVSGSWTPDGALEVTHLLDLLLQVSSNGKSLQDDRDLLIDALHLLKMVHLIGKGDFEASPFTPIRKLNDVSERDRRESSYGFKRDLIRLLGNLVYEHEENQNLVGSLDGLSLILDCSPIDGKNPFITQWVVFAVRNLTKGNLKNQEIIGEMEKSGKLDRKLLVDSGIILS